MKAKILIPLLLSAVVLSGCSFALKGTVTDVVTGQPIADAKVTISLGGDKKPRDATTNTQGKYRIKKDSKDQSITFAAQGYEDFTTVSKSDKTRDVYLIPTAEETARRIVQAMKDQDYDTAYNYLHPFDQGYFTRDQFKEINQGDFANYLSQVTEIRTAEVKSVDRLKNNILQKTFTDVSAVTIVLVMNADDTIENISAIDFAGSPARTSRGEAG